jgi:cyclopropane-fatty-acyl-phospholipid synthase
MKKILQNVLKELSSNLPNIPLEVRFWDGEINTYGSGEPVFVLVFNTEEAAKRIFSKGTLGFGEEYVAGNIDVEGDFQELIRLGMDPAFRT